MSSTEVHWLKIKARLPFACSNSFSAFHSSLDMCMLEMPDLWMNLIMFGYVHACMHANMCVHIRKLTQAYMLVEKDNMDMQADMPIQVYALRVYRSSCARCGVCKQHTISTIK